LGNLQNRLFAFRVAFEGLYLFFKNGAHAKIHLVAAIVVVFLAWYLNLSAIEWILCLISIALVLSLEAINTALEYLVDLASPEIHPLAKKSKDVAAAAVLIASIFALIIGLLIFIPHLFK
jgi:undecaprenol kinase